MRANCSLNFGQFRVRDECSFDPLLHKGGAALIEDSHNLREVKTVSFPTSSRSSVLPIVRRGQTPSELAAGARGQTRR